MKAIARSWKTILIWGLGLVAVLMVGALIDGSAISGTCMFILMPYFAAITTTVPVIAVNRFGTGILVYVPYALIGFFPLYYFDWLQSGALIGLWAVFVWSATGPLIGVCLDLANLLAGRFSARTRAIAVGATMQAVTFVIMLVGLKYLYTPTSSMSSHLYFFDREWFFTLPWMVVNGAFGGYTAYALTKRV
jgi:hypothetical protein